MAGSNKTGETQHARFIEAAKEAGADTDTSAADALMGRLAKTPPAPKPEKPAPKKERRPTR